MYHHHIYPKKLKTNENSYESSIERTDLTHLKVFSIDPEECEDIDDAMSIEVNGNVTIVGIHIAQPICWLSTEDIISKMKSTNNLSFNFIQTVNDKSENGMCVLEYPKKIWCKYDNFNKKIIVSNGNKSKNSLGA